MVGPALPDCSKPPGPGRTFLRVGKDHKELKTPGTAIARRPWLACGSASFAGPRTPRKTPSAVHTAPMRQARRPPDRHRPVRRTEACTSIRARVCSACRQPCSRIFWRRSAWSSAAPKRAPLPNRPTCLPLHCPAVQVLHDFLRWHLGRGRLGNRFQYDGKRNLVQQRHQVGVIAQGCFPRPQDVGQYLGRKQVAITSAGAARATASALFIPIDFNSVASKPRISMTILRLAKPSR